MFQIARAVYQRVYARGAQRLMSINVFLFLFFFFYKHIPLIRDCVKRNCVTRSRDAFRVIYSLIKSAERFKRQPHRMSMVITRRTRYANDNEHLLHLEVSRWLLALQSRTIFNGTVQPIRWNFLTINRFPLGIHHDRFWESRMFVWKIFRVTK